MSTAARKARSVASRGVSPMAARAARETRACSGHHAPSASVSHAPPCRAATQRVGGYKRYQCGPACASSSTAASRSARSPGAQLPPAAAQKWSSAAAGQEALNSFEQSHPDLCEELESESQFYGFSKGANLLEKHIQWVYVPAVKDAAPTTA